MMNIEEIKKVLPQRYPFLMLDRVTDINKGESIKAYKNVTANEAYSDGHFPGNPILPGALTAEAMAQAACILIQESIPDLKATNFFVTNMKIRFFKTVIPGERLEVNIKAIKMVKVGGVFETKANVGNNTVAKGEMTFACR